MEESTSLPTRRTDRVVTPREAALRRPLPERVPYEELERDFIRAWGYPHGEFMPEHLEILGPSGSGKSYLMRRLVSERARLRGTHVVIVATKKADRTLSGMGWPIVRQWPPRPGWRDKHKYDQVIFWAPAGLTKEERERQRDAIEAALTHIYGPDANIIVVFDEVAYVEHVLGLRDIIDTYMREGRSHGITVVNSTQRGSNVTRTIHSESAWAAAFKQKDDDDTERVAQILGNKLYYTRVLNDLDASKREFVLVHTRSNEAYISHMPKRPKKIAISLQKESHRRVDRSIN